MAVQDILDSAFSREADSASRQPELSLGAVNPAPVPNAPTGTMPSPSGGTKLSSLIPLLMGQQGGNRHGNSTLPSFTAGSGAGTGLAQRIGTWIDNRPGFTVSGLEGYNGTGQISSGHIDNSQHYTGHAGDVSYVGGGRFGNENAALDWLYSKLNRRWGDELTELIWQQPDHYDHLHYGTRPGG